MATYSVGDTVYGSFGQYGRHDLRIGTVAKVTPTGQTTVKFPTREVRFTPHGREVGGGTYNAARLIDAETYVRLIDSQKEQEAERAAKAATRAVGEASMRDVDAMLALIDAARAAVLAYKGFSA